jgi:hypothetical protein
MAWMKSTTTKHTCGGPVFGRKTSGCPRCDEMIAGAKPVVWNFTSRAQADAGRSIEIFAHFASHKHKTGGCGPVCTFGEW